MNRNLVGVGASILLLLAGSVQAGTIDFNSLPPNYAVTNQFPGVTFSLAGGNDPFGPPTTTWFGQGTFYGGLTDTRYGGSYPTAEFLNATFSTPVTGVVFSFYDAGFNGGNSYTLYDASHSVITSALMPQAGGFPFTYDLSSYTGVSEISWDNGLSDGGHTNSGNWWQDVQSLSFTSVVPEPGTLTLLGTGLVGLAGMIRRKARS